MTNAGASADAAEGAVAVGSSDGVTVTSSAGSASESGNASGQAYVVQTGYSLSALAQEYMGDQMRYPEIVAATNEKARQDPSFTQITDPNLIEVGQKIWIPAP
jgi:nucleoid-associated protein YgaU